MVYKHRFICLTAQNKISVGYDLISFKTFCHHFFTLITPNWISYHFVYLCGRQIIIMNKHVKSIYKKVLAAILLLGLFCMMINTCPIRSLLSSISLPGTHTEKSSAPQRLIDQGARCYGTNMIEATLLKRSKVRKNNHQNVPVFFRAGLSLASLLLCSAAKSIGEKRRYYFVERVPLFLRNQSIII